MCAAEGSDRSSRRHSGHSVGSESSKVSESKRLSSESGVSWSAAEEEGKLLPLEAEAATGKDTVDMEPTSSVGRGLASGLQTRKNAAPLAAYPADLLTEGKTVPVLGMVGRGNGLLEFEAVD